MEGGEELAERAKGAEEGAGEVAAAGSDFDEGSVTEGGEAAADLALPVGNGVGEEGVEGGGGGEVAAGSDIADIGGVVAEMGMVKGLAHEFAPGDEGVGMGVLDFGEEAGQGFAEGGWRGVWDVGLAGGMEGMGGSGVAGHGGGVEGVCWVLS